MYKFFTPKWLYFLQMLVCCMIFTAAYSQTETENPCDTTSRYIYWTGEENNDFFNEKNWRITVEIPTGSYSTSGEPVKPNCLPGDNSFLYVICPNNPDLEKDRHPKNGTIDPGVPIRYNLLMENASVSISGPISLACSQKGITLINSQLNVTQGTITQGVISLLSESTVHLHEGDYSSHLSLNFLDAASWVYFHQANPDELRLQLGRVLINNVTGVIDNNFRINQYYQQGAVIRPISNSFFPLEIFNTTGQQGASAALGENIIYSGAGIPEGMDNAARSFKLKRGYMATFAINTNGTGKSKVFIASEADLEVNELDIALQGNISFIRVVPWNWVIKKGTGGFYDQLDAGWFYNWGLANNPLPNYDYVPMAWGAGGALPASISQIIQKKKTTHVLGFNESDNCNDQSGKFNNLCEPAVAVAYFENLMGLGLRLGSPAPRENGPTTWLLEFAKIAKERDVRFDFVAVHWYDWGSSPATTPNADPQQIFNRFKAYLENVYRIYKLPIWITEFNANPNRGNAIQEAFLRLALPYLESLEYVERYAYFQPNSAFASNPVTSANYLDANGALTNIGELYKNHISRPSIPEATYISPNNLEALDQPYVSKPVNSLVFEAECGSYIGNQWKVSESADASNGLYVRGDNNLAGITSLAKQVHFEFELEEAGTYRAWIRSASTGGAGAIRIKIDDKEIEQISPFTSSSFMWFQVPRFYDLGEGKHRLTIEYPNSNILLDQIALINGSVNLDEYKKETGYCSPSTLKWGLETTDLIGIHEAEIATKGNYWSTETSVNARGGAYLASEENIVSEEIPVGTEKIISFNISVEKSDEYDIWAKIQATDPSATGLWISVDDEPFRQWSHLGNTTYEWYWKKFHFSYVSEDRSLTYFLSAGQHRVKIAIASGKVFVDRLAIVTNGKLPETIDPNVLQLGEKLVFEAEDATILGAANVVNCASSSNGKQVNLFNVNTNGVRFDQIVAEAAGAYKLKVSYMSAALRTFKVAVNGLVLGRQNPPVSGEWCSNQGSPAVHEVDVNLKRGINIIDITPFSGDAPFIDKILLEKAELNGLSLEAETAELIGNNNVVNCATASNGALVNMGLNVANGIRFNDLLSEETRNYSVDIHYITKVNRSMRITVNGEPFTTQSFLASGNWCFEGGGTKVQTMEIALSQGTNSIEFRPTGSDAPFIDKIVLRETDPLQNNIENLDHTTTGSFDVVPEQEKNTSINLYPNPAKEGTPITLSFTGTANSKGSMYLQITDMSGRVVFSQTLWQNGSGQVKLGNSLRKGMYILTIIKGTNKTSKKIIVQ